MVGNLSNFTKIDILRCLLNIDKTISRLQLSKQLDLGEGTVRSILDILKENNLLVSNKKGHSLSEEGSRVSNKIMNNIDMKNIDLLTIFPDKKKTGIQIRNPKKIEKVYVLRDTAVKNGADGALILNYDGKLKVYDSDYEQDFSEIENKFALSKNDLVVVCYADSYMLAEYGAVAVAIELCDDIKNIMQELK